MAKATTAPVKYLDLISQSQKEVDTAQLEFRAQEAALSVDSAILETKKQIASKKIELANAQRAIPYSLNRELEVVTEIEQLEKGLAFAEQVKVERF